MGHYLTWPIAAVVGLATFIAAVGVIVAAVRGVSKKMSKVVDAYESFIGVPANDITGEEARPGVMRRLNDIDSGQLHIIRQLDQHADQISKIDKELHPNGGTSFRDQVIRLDWRISQLADDFKTHMDKQ